MSKKQETPALGKTRADAEKFAETLSDKTEAQMFLGWFDAGDKEKLAGHFPAFFDEKKGGN